MWEPRLPGLFRQAPLRSLGHPGLFQGRGMGASVCQPAARRAWQRSQPSASPSPPDPSFPPIRPPRDAGCPRPKAPRPLFPTCVFRARLFRLGPRAQPQQACYPTGRWRRRALSWVGGAFRALVLILTCSRVLVTSGPVLLSNCSIYARPMWITHAQGPAWHRRHLGMCSDQGACRGGAHQVGGASTERMAIAACTAVTAGNSG